MPLKRAVSTFGAAIGSNTNTSITKRNFRYGNFSLLFLAFFLAFYFYCISINSHCVDPIAINFLPPRFTVG